jgi:DNA-binding CsgD family transcriptional regulator
VLGAAGIGKTRLVAEAAAQAQASGVRVGRAACRPLTASLPFDPVLELLNSLGETISGGGGGSPRELFGIVVDRLERASAAGTMLLCMDDLQWSDAATIDLVHYCLARLTDLPIAWLLAARSGRSLGGFAHRLERSGLADRLELAALSAAETRLLTEAIVGRARADDVVGAVLARTGGNPFLCVELLHAFRARAGGESESLDALTPGSVSQAIERRAGQVSGAAQEALRWASVLPEPMTFVELEAVGGRDVGCAPEELAEAGFLVGAGPGRWSFVHSIVRDAVYRRMSERERLRRHSAVAEALAGGPLERLAPQLAHARRWREAAEAYLELGEAAQTRGHGEDAAQLFQRSHELAIAAGDERLRRAADAGRVLAHVRAEAIDEARREAALLRAELRARGDPAERLSFLSRYAHDLILFHDAYDIGASADALDEAEPLIADATGEVLAHALAARAIVRQQRGASSDALADAKCAAVLARTAGNIGLEANALVSLGLAVGIAEDPVRGIAILEQGLDRAVAADDTAEAARARLNLGYVSMLAGDDDAPRRHLELGLELLGVPAMMRALLHASLSDSLADVGDLDGALAHQLASRRQVTRMMPYEHSRMSDSIDPGRKPLALPSAITLARIHIMRGDLAAARRELEVHESPTGSVLDLVAHELWGRLLEEEGRPLEALAHYQRGIGIDDATSAHCEAGIARSAVAVEDVVLARAAVERLEQEHRRSAAHEWCLEEARGWVAVGEGHTHSAVGHLRRAAELCPHRYEAKRIRLDAAGLARDRDHVMAALVEFEDMGASRAVARARSISRELGMRPRRRRAGKGPLSSREQEVAQLVSAGHTNAEIAAALYMSPRTVERHVSNILLKLGYRLRVQLAAEAAAGRLPGS